MNILDPDIYARGNPALNGLPLADYHRLQDATPCFRQIFDDPAFIDEVWVVSRYKDALDILRDTKRFTSRMGASVRRFHPTLPKDGGKPAMITMDGPDHHRNRTAVSRMFTPAAVQAYESHFRKIAVGIVDRVLTKKGETLDFVWDIAAQMPLHAICDLMGVPHEDRPQVLAWSNVLTVPVDKDVTPSTDEFMTALRGIWSYGVKIVNDRRDAPGEDVMSVIMQAVEDGRVSEDEVMGYMLILSAAGNETTRNAAAHGMLGLIQHPEQMAYMRANADNIPQSAFDEILRWASPAIHTLRTAVNDVELHGQRIKAGDPIAVLIAAANFDPRQFPEPMRFDLKRTPNENIAFGLGIHICLGIHVARLELKVLFEELMRRIAHIELAGEVEYIRDNMLRGIKKMPVVLS